MIERKPSRLVVSLLIGLLVVSGCQGENPPPVEVEGADPQRGAQLIVQYDCGECHRIPGIDGAEGRTAPGLTVWPNRAFVADVMQNTPQNTADFIREPDRYLPGTEMPNFGMSEQESLDIAAYLFTLR